MLLFRPASSCANGPLSGGARNPQLTLNVICLSSRKKHAVMPKSLRNYKLSVTSELVRSLSESSSDQPRTPFIPLHACKIRSSNLMFSPHMPHARYVLLRYVIFLHPFCHNTCLYTAIYQPSVKLSVGCLVYTNINLFFQDRLCSISNMHAADSHGLGISGQFSLLRLSLPPWSHFFSVCSPTRIPLTLLALAAKLSSPRLKQTTDSPGTLQYALKFVNRSLDIEVLGLDMSAAHI